MVANQELQSAAALVSREPESADSPVAQILFPFYIALNRKLEVTGLGPSIRKILPSLHPGASLLSHFLVERPKCESPTLGTFLDPNCVYLLRHAHLEIPFRGQMIFDPKEEILSFYGSPWLPAARSLHSLGLTFSDFAPHDPTPEFVQLTHSHRTAMSELSMLAEKLQQQKRALREANLKLQASLSESRAAQEKAESASLAKTNFIATVSHEIRTPLNGILGLTQLLLESSVNDQHRDYLRAIDSSGSHLLMIINDILDFSKFEAGQLNLEIRPFSFERLLEDLDKLLQPLARRKNSKLQLSSEGLEAPALGDELRVRQILLNLIHNSIKFTDQGQIEVFARRVSETLVTITVEDTGIGIAEDKLPLIFDSFTQADASTTRRFGGTGLGLSIVKRIVEQMNGSITVSSELGVGSVFSLTLPLTALRQLNNTANPSAVSTSSLSPLVDEHGVPYHPRVLLVEDNPINRLVARGLLDRLGCQVFEADNGKQATEMTLTQKHDLILMDCMMPVLDGLEATRLIRSQEKRSSSPPLPIIGLTAQVLGLARGDCLAAGMNDVLSKPICIPDFLAAIKHWTHPRAELGLFSPLTQAEGADKNKGV